jgi:hypothetical protein
VLPKYLIIKDPNDIILVLWIIIVQKFKNFQLHSSLVLKFLFISDYFNSYQVAIFMIQAFDRLTETAGAKGFEDFISVAKVVLHHGLVIALVVIIAVIVNIHLLQSFDLSLTGLL